jgi:hypothetical protein
MHLIHTERFVVFQVQSEWLVTAGDLCEISYPTRKEAETWAFDAADALASQGRAVCVLILPEEPGARQHPVSLTGRTPRVKPN